VVASGRGMAAWETVGEGKGIVRAISVSGPVSLNPIKFSAWLILESAPQKARVQ